MNMAMSVCACLHKQTVTGVWYINLSFFSSSLTVRVVIYALFVVSLLAKPMTVSLWILLDYGFIMLVVLYAIAKAMDLSSVFTYNSNSVWELGRLDLLWFLMFSTWLPIFFSTISIHSCSCQSMTVGIEEILLVIHVYDMDMVHKMGWERNCAKIHGLQS